MAALPACQRCCDLAQQGFHQHCQIDLLSDRHVDAWRVLLEQTRLEVFGPARHFRLSPFLIRIVESLEAHRPRCAGTAEYRGKNAAPRRSRIEKQPRASSTRAGRQASCLAVE